MLSKKKLCFGKVLGLGKCTLHLQFFSGPFVKNINYVFPFLYISGEVQKHPPFLEFLRKNLPKA